MAGQFDNVDLGGRTIPDQIKRARRLLAEQLVALMESGEISKDDTVENIVAKLIEEQNKG
jgi:predicted oxidoreductase